jgi:hypothetical protein
VPPLHDLGARYAEAEQESAMGHLVDGGGGHRRMTSLPFGIIKPGTVVDAVRASLHPPAIDQTPITRVLKAYGRRQTGRTRYFTLAWRSAIVAVPTDKETVVMKRYSDRWTPSTILHEHGILDELHARGFPAVRLLHTVSDGASIVDDEGGVYSVFELLRHRESAESQSTVGSIAPGRLSSSPATSRTVPFTRR